MKSNYKQQLGGVLAAAFLSLGIPAFADESPSGKINAKVFANWHQDYFGPENSTFDLTRAYFGFSYAFDSSISSKVILDVGRLNELATASFDTTTRSVTTKKESRYEAFLKNAYLEWKGLVPATILEVGVVNNKLMYLQEKTWGYRYIFKSFMDENKFTAYSDLGVNAVVAPIDGLKVNLSLMNGEGFTLPQDENGEYKAGGGLEATLPVGVSAYAFADYMPFKGKEAQSTYTGFLAYEIKSVFRVGGEMDYLMNSRGVKDAHLLGTSFYGTYIITPKYEVFGRYDRLTSEKDWNKKGTDGQAIIAGVQYAPLKGVKVAANYQVFMPSIEDADSQSKVFMNLEFAY